MLHRIFRGFIVGIYLLVISFTNFSYASTDALWNRTFDLPIKWQMIAPTGTLLVQTSAMDKKSTTVSSYLYGIDDDTSAALWKKELSVDPEDIVFLTDTPYIQLKFPVDEEAEAEGKETRYHYIIFNMDTGDEVVDSRKQGLVGGVAKRYLLYNSGNILLHGFKKLSKPVLMMCSSKDGSILWENEELFTKAATAVKSLGLGKLGALGKGLETLGTNAEASMNAVACDPIDTGDNAFILATLNKLYKMDMATGKPIWESDLPELKSKSSFSTSSSQQNNVTEDYTRIIFSPVGSIFYYIRPDFVMAYNIDDGQQIWDDVFKTKASVTGKIIFDPKGLILCPIINSGSGKINFIDYDKGQSLWKKPIKVKGGVNLYDFVEDGIFVALQGSEGKNGLNILDVENGAMLFKKAVDVKGTIKNILETDKGILFISTQEINVIDPKTGKMVFKKSIKAKGSNDRFLMEEQGNIIYVYSVKSNKLYTIDKTKGEYKQINTEIEKPEGGDTIASMELYDDRILLISQQNIITYNLDGTLKSHVYNKAPGQGMFAKLYYATQAVRMAAITVQASQGAAELSKAKDNAKTPAGRKLYNDFAQLNAKIGTQAASYAGDAFSRISKRFTMSKQARDYVMMLVVFKEYADKVPLIIESGAKKNILKKDIGLLKVTKLTGANELMINLKSDKTPSYELDTAYNRIYYRSGAKDLSSFDLDQK